MAGPATLEIVLYCSTPFSAFEAIKTWIGPYAKSTIIYSTSPVPVREILQFRRVVYLPNILTESQAYLHHIATRFQSLADVTIFCHSKSSSYFTIPITRMMELASLTEVGEVMTFPGNDLVRFDTWELQGSFTETTNGNDNGIVRAHQRRQANPDASILLSGQALELFRADAHTITTPASVLWNAMAPSSKFHKLPFAVGYQPGSTFAVRMETIQQNDGEYWARLYPQYFRESVGNTAALEAGYYLSKFWWAFLSDDYILHEDDVVDKRLWVLKSGGRRELTKGNWIRRLQPDAVVPNAKGRNLHHFRTRSCSIGAENPLINNMALYGLPSLSPVIEKNQSQSLGLVSPRIELKKARSMAMLTLGMSKLDVRDVLPDRPASIHRSVTDSSAY